MAIAAAMYVAEFYGTTPNNLLISENIPKNSRG
jgi:hypothetical protein